METCKRKRVSITYFKITVFSRPLARVYFVMTLATLVMTSVSALFTFNFDSVNLNAQVAFTGHLTALEINAH